MIGEGQSVQPEAGGGGLSLERMGRASAQRSRGSCGAQPDDPLFYPGFFFVGVHGAKESQFEISAELVKEKVSVHDCIRNLEGNGYK